MPRDGILVVGSANMDLVVMTGRFPEPGETLLGGRFDMFPGGKGANQAVAASRLGARVTFIGKMGRDLFGERLAAGMKRDGVRLNRLLHDPRGSTGIALITVDRKGQNEIVVVSGSNMKLTSADIDRQRPVFSSVRAVLLQLEIPLPTVIHAARLARDHDLTVVLNPAPARTLPVTLLRMVDYLTPNESELAQLTGRSVRGVREAGQAARVLLEVGVKNVIVTLGARGALLVNRREATLCPAWKVSPVDTTAAGDAFNGALAMALASGQTVEAAIPFANAVAALSTTRRGAQSSMPRLEEVRAFVRGRPPLWRDHSVSGRCLRHFLLAKEEP
jgi:ribokinase